MKSVPQSFWDTPLCVTLALWLCSMPVTVFVVGSLWGLWPAAMAALATLVVMLALCLALCWGERAENLRATGGATCQTKADHVAREVPDPVRSGGCKQRKERHHGMVSD